MYFTAAKKRQNQYFFDVTIENAALTSLCMYLDKSLKILTYAEIEILKHTIYLDL